MPAPRATTPTVSARVLRALVDAFAMVAKHLPRDAQRTIQAAAHERGFAEATTFHRAFKRSSGTTPSKFRSALLRSDSR